MPSNRYLSIQSEKGLLIDEYKEVKLGTNFLLEKGTEMTVTAIQKTEHLEVSDSTVIIHYVPIHTTVANTSMITYKGFLKQYINSVV